eukprot:gene60841-81123_t
MHMHRDPQTMQAVPMSGDVIPQVLSFLQAQVQLLRALKVDASRITLDPGVGFGKTVAQNFALLARQRELLDGGGLPLLLGWSRKSSIGAVTGIEAAGERIVPSVAAAVLAVDRGAAVVRVHDVRDTVAAIARATMTRRYFGTDGIRGTVGQAPITPDFVLRLAHAVGRVLKKSQARPTVLIGKDTRISGYMLES